MYIPLSVFLGLSAFAEPIDPFTIPDEAQRFRQERQVVTVAARYAQTIEEAPSIVRVITADDIVQQGFRTLSDVLRTIPGVYVALQRSRGSLAGFVALSVQTTIRFFF